MPGIRTSSSGRFRLCSEEKGWCRGRTTGANARGGAVPGMNAAKEIEAGDRFQLGANWANFVRLNPDGSTKPPELSLKEMLGVADLRGQRFLDISSGSGLFSLAARRLGRQRPLVDLDRDSVQCTQELKQRYFPGDDGWTIEKGSVLDRAYMEGLGRSTSSIAWGVLHHTGAMWLAIENAIARVATYAASCSVAALYNDQGWKSHVWWPDRKRV